MGGMIPHPGERATALSDRKSQILEGRNQTVRSTRKWPVPDVRERQLFGESMRTTGTKQGNQKLKNPLSILSKISMNAPGPECQRLRAEPASTAH
jgi:hypothetical protein